MKLAIIIATTVIVTAAAIMGGLSFMNKDSEGYKVVDQVEVVEEEARPYKPGESVEFNNRIVTVTGFSTNEDTLPDEVFSTDMRWISVDFTIENIGDEELEYQSNDMILVPGENEGEDLIFFNNPQFDGSPTREKIQPGETMETSANFWVNGTIKEVGVIYIPFGIDKDFLGFNLTAKTSTTD